jgi:hypothetical protein
MNPEKVKLIIHNLEVLLESLKQEIQEPLKCEYEEIVPYIEEEDVDEYYVEEEEYV